MHLIQKGDDTLTSDTRLFTNHSVLRTGRCHPRRWGQDFWNIWNSFVHLVPKLQWDMCPITVHCAGDIWYFPVWSPSLAVWSRPTFKKLLLSPSRSSFMTSWLCACWQWGISPVATSNLQLWEISSLPESGLSPDSEVVSRPDRSGSRKEWESKALIMIPDGEGEGDWDQTLLSCSSCQRRSLRS